jgi:hypothetical protein
MHHPFKLDQFCLVDILESHSSCYCFVIFFLGLVPFLSKKELHKLNIKTFFLKNMHVFTHYQHFLENVILSNILSKTLQLYIVSHSFLKLTFINKCLSFFLLVKSITSLKLEHPSKYGDWVENWFGNFVQAFYERYICT